MSERDIYLGKVGLKLSDVIAERDRLRAQVERLEEELAEQYWETVDYGGSYDQETGVFNSCALGGVAWAMNRLVELGQAEPVGDQSGRVIEIRRAAVLRETDVDTETGRE